MAGGVVGLGNKLKVIWSLLSTLFWAEAMPEAARTANAASKPRVML
jgi:hypothetical protein